MQWLQFSANLRTPDYMRVCAMISVLFYDPIFTSLFGGTIGHFLLGIRVKKADSEIENISFSEALSRFIVKILLGMFSFITINSHKRKRAIHDLAAGSIVIYVGGNHDVSSFEHRSATIPVTDEPMEDSELLNDNK
jgi:uncharacterized RDD family membrane protein YckC